MEEANKQKLHVFAGQPKSERTILLSATRLLLWICPWLGTSRAARPEELRLVWFVCRNTKLQPMLKSE